MNSITPYRGNPQRIHKKDRRTNKWIPQTCRVQEQHKKPQLCFCIIAVDNLKRTLTRQFWEFPGCSVVRTLSFHCWVLQAIWCAKKKESSNSIYNIFKRTKYLGINVNKGVNTCTLETTNYCWKKLKKI